MSKYYEVEGTATIVFHEIVEAGSSDAAIAEIIQNFQILGQNVIDLTPHDIKALDSGDFSDE